MEGPLGTFERIDLVIIGAVISASPYVERLMSLYSRIGSLIPRSLRDKVWHDLLIPKIVSLGWRHPKYIPTSDLYLTGDYCYDGETEIKEAVRVVRDNTMLSFERLATLWQQVRYLDTYEIPGDLVECGVWKGGAVGMAMLAHGQSCRPPVRAVHLFDSFEGLPEPIAELDGEDAVMLSENRASGLLQPLGKGVGPIEDCKRLLDEEIDYPQDLIHYHVGWFQDTLPEDADSIERIALLRLDGDWYESTLVCLKHLYPKVVSGGVVVIDDYGHWEGCRRAVDEFRRETSEPIALQHIDYAGRCWIRHP